jgi:hypothetical protein
LKNAHECTCVCAILCKLGKKFTETFKLLNQAHREDCMSQTQCCEWIKHFKEGRVLVSEVHRTGQPSTSTNDDHFDRVFAVIRRNHRIAVREVADEEGISIASCHQIFTYKCQMCCLTPAHTPLLTCSYSAKHQTSVVPQPPYSLDLAPADFFLFPKLNV